MNPLATVLARANLEQNPKFPWSSGAALASGGGPSIPDEAIELYFTQLLFKMEYTVCMYV